MQPPVSRAASPAVFSAGAVLAIVAIVVLFYDLGPQARHMGLHIVSMNIVAPLLAACVAARWRNRPSGVALLWIAAILQIVLLWAWHAPVVQGAAMSLPGLQLAMHGFLLLAAMLFWTSLLRLSGARRWQAIPALLLTGKLVCLLAALLIFSPRALYGATHHLAHLAEQSPALHALADQHLAGLLMISACPLSYLVAAVIIAIQLVRPPEASDATSWRQSPQTAG